MRRWSPGIGRLCDGIGRQYQRAYELVPREDLAVMPHGSWMLQTFPGMLRKMTDDKIGVQ